MILPALSEDFRSVARSLPLRVLLCLAAGCVALAPAGAHAATLEAIIADDVVPHSKHGWAVDIDGATAIVGAPGENDNAGAARIFELDVYGTGCGAGTWCPVARLEAPELESRDAFGAAVAIEGDRAFVGAYGDDDLGNASGAVYVYERGTGEGSCAEGEWCRVEKLTASDASGYSGFGFALAADAGRLLVGARFAGPGTGAAYVYSPAGDHDCKADTVRVERWCEASLPVGAVEGSASFGNAVALHGNRAVVGAMYDATDGFAAGSAFLYELDANGSTCGEGSWCPAGRLAPADAVAFKYFGWSVAVSGDRILVGAIGDGHLGDRAGSVYLFRRNEGGDACGAAWCESRITATDGAPGAHFGFSVSADGESFIVGAFGAGGNTGAAYLFRRNVAGLLCTDHAWCQRRLAAADGKPGDYLGVAVALSGPWAIAGAYRDDGAGEMSGTAYAYRAPSADTRIDIGKGAENDELGTAVAMEGDLAAVGAPGAHDDAGVVSLFRRWREGQTCPAGWCRVATLTAGDGAAGDRYGVAVDMDDRQVIVGTNADAAYIHVWDEPTESWCQGARLVAGEGREGGRFGIAVAIDGSLALVGANGFGDSAGTAYLLQRDPESDACAQRWERIAELSAADAASGDHFGTAVALHGGVAVVGAPMASAPGGSPRHAGTVHVFEPCGVDWCQVAQLRIPDARANDLFGYDVSVHDDGILVGAPGRDGYARNTGAAYLFERAKAGAPCEEPWCLAETFVSAQTPSQGGYGISVALRDDRVAIGAWSDGRGGVRTGAAHLHARNTGGGYCDGADAWCDVMITAPGGAAGDLQGASVALGEDALLVGAPGDDGRATNAGAAHIRALAISRTGEAIGLIGNPGVGRTWGDGSLAASCSGYRNPPDGYAYAGETGDGSYRIDPDGPGGQDSYAAWCDMTLDGGGWTLVANQASTGGWMPVDSDLDPAASHGTYRVPGAWKRGVHYFRAFDELGHDELLFRSGDDTPGAWCVLPYDEVARVIHERNGDRQPNVTVLASGGTGVGANGTTNVLMRAHRPEDPWIGCEGNHVANRARMLWGEAGSGFNTGFKNDSGIGVFVRPGR